MVPTLPQASELKPVKRGCASLQFVIYPFRFSAPQLLTFQQFAGRLLESKNCGIFPLSTHFQHIFSTMKTHAKTLLLLPLLAAIVGCRTASPSSTSQRGALIGGRKVATEPVVRQPVVDNRQFAENRRDARLSDIETEIASLRNELDSISGSLDRSVTKSEQTSRSANADTRAEVAAIRDEIAVLRKKVDAMPGVITTLVDGREKSMRDYVDQSVKASEARLTTAISRRTQPASSGGNSGSVTYSGEAYEHTVKSGETLSEIAQAYGVTVKEIQSANKNLDPSKIRVGQVVRVPKK